MTIGERIKSLRKEKGWSQALLGQMVDLHVGHIGRYEKNKVKPSAKSIKKLAEAFGISINELVRGDEKPTLEGLIKDKELLRMFQGVEELDEKDKTLAKGFLQLLVMKRQFQQVLAQNQVG
jgi:transcriptional regulator with XRE-family HTH domain